MTSYDDYLTLARHLSELYRHGQRAAAEDNQRRGAHVSAADALDQRLTAQRQTLTQLARSIGQPDPDRMPPPPPLDAAAHPDARYVEARLLPNGQLPGDPAPVSGSPVGEPQPVSGAPVSGGASPGGPALDGDPDDPELEPAPKRIVLPPRGSGARRPSPGPSGAPAPVPVRPGGGTVAPGATGHGAIVPGQRTPAGQPPAPPPLDPYAELDLARQAADAADAAAKQTEKIAGQPPLLPTWSQQGRAVAIYLAAALIGVFFQLALVVAAQVQELSTATIAAWMCAGLPAIAFFAGYFAIGIWGKPKIELDIAPPLNRYGKLGFGICFTVLPVLTCLYIGMTRFFA